MALLHWHKAPKDGKLEEKRKGQDKIVMSGAAPPFYLKLPEEDEAALCNLEAKPIPNKEMALGKSQKGNICHIHSITNRGWGGLCDKENGERGCW